MRQYAALFAPMVLLATLPFPHTVGLRLSCLGIAALTAIALWRTLDVPPLPCKAAIGLWVAVILASLPGAVDLRYSLGEIKAEVGYGMIAFVSCFALATNEARVRAAGLATAAGLAAIALGVVIGYVRTGTWPLGAWYGEAAPVTHYLVTVVPFVALTVMLAAGERAGMALAAVGIVTVGLAILSGQRATWLALGPQALIALVWLIRTKAAPMRRAGVAAVAGAIVAATVAGLLTTDSLRVEAEPYAAMEKDLRPAVWKDVALRIAQNPLVGAGYGRHALVKAHPDLIPPENPLFWHAHNVVLNYGLSAGVPGMLAILVLFGAIGRRFWRLAVGDDATNRAIGLAGAAMVLGVFLRNQHNDLFVREGSVIFWALAGVMLGYALRRERRLARSAGS